MSNPSPLRLGIDLGGTKVEAALMTDDGLVVWRQRLPTPAGDYAATVQTLAELTRAARDAAQQVTQQVTHHVARHLAHQAAFTIGIGTPGTRGASGLMKNCNSTVLNGRPLQHDVEQALGQPVRMANDANCLALSESVDGAGAGASVVLAIIIGTGTGAGIVVDGRIVAGANGVAGEWGHNPLPRPWPGPGASVDQATDAGWDEAADGDASAPGCWCGRRGCIEAFVSGPGLAADHARRHGGQVDAATIAARAVAGDAGCAATLDRHTRRLARALAGVVNVLDPDVIVLGGGLSLMPHLYAQLPPLIACGVLNSGAAEPLRMRLLPALHGDASGVRGAAWLWR